MRALVSIHPELLFVWAGVGDLQRDLEQDVERAGLSPFVRFLGWVDRREMPSLYRCFDAYLHPAVGEPFGFAIAEAMLNGVPVAATRCGSTEEAVHLREVYLLDEGAVGDIVSAVLFFFADAGRLDQLALAGRQFALERLTVERYWEEHCRLYRSAMHRSAV
jgi:glycosyltransferase involved in cell wall biosynthesis